MSEGIEFSDETIITETPSSTPFSTFPAQKKPAFSLLNFVQRINLARNEHQAELILISMSIVCFVISFGILSYFVFGVGTSQAVTYIVSDTAKAKLPLDLQQKIDAAQKSQKK